MDLNESVDIVLACGEELADRFYEVFFLKYPEAKQYFEHVKLKRQGVLLTMAMRLAVEFHCRGHLSTESFLQYLGTKHHDWGIPLELFPGFCDSMLLTLAEVHGDRWDRDLQHQWIAVLEGAVQSMQVGYSQHFSV